MSNIQYLRNHDGFFIGSFVDFAESNLPDGAIEVPFPPDDVRQRWSDAENRWEPLPPVDLDNLKSALKAQIDEQAETERLRYITPGAGQALTYEQKRQEAKRYLETDDPQDGDFPMLQASLGIEGESLRAVAELITANNAQWLLIGAAIERVRLASKMAVAAAETADEAQVVINNVGWPDPTVAQRALGVKP